MPRDGFLPPSFFFPFQCYSCCHLSIYSPLSIYVYLETLSVSNFWNNGTGNPCSTCYTTMNIGSHLCLDRSRTTELIPNNSQTPWPPIDGLVACESDFVEAEVCFN
jgi:hypothetical protein